MKKTKLMGLAAIAFLLIGGLILFAGCSNSTSSDNVVKYTVTFSGNGNTGGTVPAKLTQSAEGASVTIPGAGNLVKTDNNFAGWNTKADGSGSDVAAGAYIPTANMTLYAQWTPVAPGEHTIAVVAVPLEAGTITTDVSSAAPGDPVLVTVEANAGYTFEKVTADGVDIAASEFTNDAGVYTYTWTMLNKAVDIEAYFSFEVSINYNGFGGTDSSVTKMAGDTIDKPADPTNPLQSYVYRYAWFDDATAGNEVTFPYELTGPVTLYARVAFLNRADYDIYENTIAWQSDNYSLMMDYDQYMTQASSDPGSLMLLFIDPRLPNTGNIFTVNPFAGSPKLSIPVSDLIPLPVGISGASVLPADVIGSYGARGSSGTNQTLIVGSPDRNKIVAGDLDNVMVLDFTHDLAWAGWSGFGNGNVGHDVGSVTILRAETWVPKNGTVTPDVRFTVNFDGNGYDSGSVPAAMTQSAAGAVLTLPDAGDMGKAGFIFDSWNTAANGTGTKVPAGAYNPTKSITLYAQWVLPFDQWDRSNFNITTYDLSTTSTPYGSDVPVSLPQQLTDDLRAAQGTAGSKLVFFINAGNRFANGGNLIGTGYNSNASATGNVHTVADPLVVKPMPLEAFPDPETVIGRYGSTKDPTGGSANQLIQIDDTLIVESTMVLFSWPETSWNLTIGGTPANNMLSISGTTTDQMLVAVQGNATDHLYLLLVELWVPKS